MSKAEHLYEKYNKRPVINAEPADFTFAEIDVLIQRGFLDKSDENKFGIQYASKSTNQGFGHYSVSKYADGQIVYHYSFPTNVDPDWGTYDTSSGSEYYKTFEDFITNKPYYKD